MPWFGMLKRCAPMRVGHYLTLRRGEHTALLIMEIC
ncbi:hypothetical protein T4D_17132 [Trichinella pseudospiralis]|uniref:Uncharacterized protein n=1 Tax=Trichinella pseudospiralis TaxID=6337 RepID=A0A0V1DNR6_TRIPS|nr:hypothetical protein T4D_17132 [Trichinella pseudospiralis]